MSQDFRQKDVPTKFFNGTRRDRGGGDDQTIDKDLQMVNRRWNDALRVAAD